jgi:hypothetical protein
MSDQNEGTSAEGKKSESVQPIPISHEEAAREVDEDEAVLEPVEEGKQEEEEEEAISLVDVTEAPSGAVRAFGAAAAKHEANKKQFNRPLNLTGKGATRCRMFHCKIADASIEHMEETINDWLDSNEDIEVKHVGHMVGTMTGKKAEPNIILTVWY